MKMINLYEVMAVNQVYYHVIAAVDADEVLAIWNRIVEVEAMTVKIIGQVQGPSRFLGERLEELSENTSDDTIGLYDLSELFLPGE